MLSLADAILQEDIKTVQKLLQLGEDPNQIDEYGFTPLIEAAIVDNVTISKTLLLKGAIATGADVTGNTALHWAAENNNLDLAKLLLQYGANANAYNFAGQPVLVMPLLREQQAIKQVFIQAGADLVFAQDYINTKLLGHLFELMGTVNIISPENEFVEVDLEGFFLEVTIGLVADSLAQFRNHYAARLLRRFAGIGEKIIEVLQRSSILIKYQQYRVNITKHLARIDSLMQQEPLLIPVGYEGHAITFIKYRNIWVKCDRREDSRLYDNIMFYSVKHTQELNANLFKYLIYEKQSSQFINVELDQILGLQPLTELQIEAQISGNCSWANVEAVIPSLFFLLLMTHSTHDDNPISHFKSLALNYFHRWREWNKDRALNFCIQSFKDSDSIRKACKAEILAAILFQHCQSHAVADRNRMESIIKLLLNSEFEYILKNYIKIYHFEGYTAEGKYFAELMKQHGLKF